MKTKRLRCVPHLVIGVLTAYGLVGCSVAREVPAVWKSDCVGRIQFSLPEEIEVAATTKQDLLRSWEPTRFVDGQAAYQSSLVYLGGIQIIHGLSMPELDALIETRTKGLEKFRMDAQKAKGQAQAQISNAYRELNVAPQTGIGFQAQGQRYLTLRLGPNAFAWSSYSGLDSQDLQSAYAAIIQGLRTRDLFVTPAESGVCLPYAFIRDDGMNARGIGVTYRLRKHPDVTIFLKDATAATNPRKEVLTAKYRTNDFWGQYAGDTVKSAWFPTARDVQLAGQPGMATFVQFERRDGTQDYGYLAVAPGDSGANEDKPDLMLYVIRDAKYAKAKGIEAIDKDALLQMAQTIAASVKRRPTNQ